MRVTINATFAGDAKIRYFHMKRDEESYSSLLGAMLSYEERWRELQLSCDKASHQDSIAAAMVADKGRCDV